MSDGGVVFVRQAVFAAVLALGLTCASATSLWAQPHGMYTDKAVYAPGERIDIYASAPQTERIAFSLVRHGLSDEPVADSAAVQIGPQPTRVGSFVEVDNITLAGRQAFTLEGWWYPTMVGGDAVTIAGQGGPSAGAGLELSPQGNLAGFITTQQSGLVEIEHNQVLAIDTWHHIALTYDGDTLELYLDGQTVASAAASGAVTAIPDPFRVGAGPSAPGDLTGIIDGRIDSWAVWPNALTGAQIQQRRQAAQASPDPTPDPAEVDLFLGFEDAYGEITDSSRHAHRVRIINHGTPRVVGVHRDGLGLRLNHDQLVDAQWGLTATIRLPDDAQTGLYSIQAPSPNFDERRWPPLQTSVVVRPDRPRETARIAVVVPVNTWVAYNPWPGYNFDAPPIEEDTITPRRRTPDGSLIRGGNNSAYTPMGDGSSMALFQGWRRPNPHASVDFTAGYDFSLRAKLSLEVVRWLEREGFAYDVYTDWGMDSGQISAGDYDMVFVHGHSEYWSRAALDHVMDYASEGGNLIFMSGNSIYWHVAQTADHLVQETRKWPTFVRPTALGPNDRVTAIGEEKSGLWELMAHCEDPMASPTLITGALFDILTGGHPSTFGRWEVTDGAHWLWPDQVNDGDQVGQSPYDDVFTVGHEADTFDPMRPPPGLAPGSQVAVLAEGVGFPRPEVASHRRNMSYRPDCDEIEAVLQGEMQPTAPQNLEVTSDTRAGSILYYRHAGGGHVLTVGSTASTWALRSDPAISGLVRNAIECFAFDEGCFGESSPGDVADAPDIVDSGEEVADGDEDSAPDTERAEQGDASGCSASRGTTSPIHVVLLVGLLLWKRFAPRWRATWFSSGNPGPSEGEMTFARSKSSEEGVCAAYVDAGRR